MSNVNLTTWWRSAWQLLKEVVTEWREDRAAQFGAALAYYSVFSMGPLLLIVIAIASMFFGRDAVQGELYSQLSAYVGPNGAKGIEAMIAGARASTTTEGMAALTGVILLLFAATGVIIQLKDALNAIWNVPPDRSTTVGSFVKKYLISIAAVLGLGFLLIISLTVSAALAFFGKYLGGTLPVPVGLLNLLNFVISFAVISLFFALVFKLLPDTHTDWRDVRIGAITTAVLFLLGKSAIGLYLGRQDFKATFGAAEPLIVFLVWVYFSSQIVFFGGELTQVYARRFGSRRGLEEGKESSLQSHAE